MNRYDKCAAEWNKIFQSEECKVPVQKESGNQNFDQGLAWVAGGTDTILDFGCGNGMVLFWAALYGTKQHVGIDLSSEAIKTALRLSKEMQTGEYEFLCGDVSALQKIGTETIDAVVLSNIIDNLYPEDADCLLNEVHRVLKDNGKVMVKLNPYIKKEEFETYGMKEID